MKHGEEVQCDEAQQKTMAIGLSQSQISNQLVVFFFLQSYQCMWRVTCYFLAYKIT